MPCWLLLVLLEKDIELSLPRGRKGFIVPVKLQGLRRSAVFTKFEVLFIQQLCTISKQG